MYIPKPYLQDCLTTEISASGGDFMYDYITGSQIRRAHYFGYNTGSYEFEVHQGCTDSTELLLVAGGAGGGFGEVRLVGSGAPYFLSAPNSYIGCTGATYQTGGGGGGGGVVNINPQKDMTGSLQLVPGKYPINVGGGGIVQLDKQGGLNFNTDGGSTSFKYAYQIANEADLPSGSTPYNVYEYTSSAIVAGGGGKGAYVEWVVTTAANCGFQAGNAHWFQQTYNATSGSSGGGGSISGCGDGGEGTSTGSAGINLYPYLNQGTDGEPWGFYNDSIVQGGSGGSGIPSGSGIEFQYRNTRGYNQEYSRLGRAGERYSCGPNNYFETLPFSSGSDYFYFPGAGGFAFIENYTSSLSIQPNNWSQGVQDTYFLGKKGEAMVTYALTGSQLTNGKLHYLDGGVNGGIFSFIPCGEVRVETLEVPAGKQACICAMDTGQDLYLGGTYRDYWWEDIPTSERTGSNLEFSPEKMMDQLPSGSGTVTFTTGSECNAYVPFEGWETCGSCKQSGPAGIYIGFDISGSSGSPFHKYPNTVVHYTSSQNYITSSEYNTPPNVYETRIGAISNDFDTDIPYSNFVPSASFSSSYGGQNVDFTTGSECFTYYECRPFDESPITASGGETGSFVSGSWIYKYHIFEASGSANEVTTRSFQELTISNGYSDDVNILVIGPGGAGGPATGSNNGNLFYGGGGGAGQVKIEKLNGLCNAYNLKIAPGFPYPTLEGNSPTPDVWQQYFGQTIISASDGIYYTSAGIGGRGSAPLQFNGNTTMGDWNSRSGSGGGGAAISSLVSDGYITGGYDTLQTNGGDGFNGTGSAGGGGGAGQDGFDGSGGITAQGGEGGEGLRLNFDGTLRWYAGGGAGYGPGGPSDGGIGGGGTSGIGLSTGSFYGAGGGAWLGPSTGYTTPWGDSYILNGRGADGAVIINYKWKFNTSPTGSIVIRGLSQYYDIYDENSYDGTGSLVYSLWSNDTTASLGNLSGWIYDDDNLGSGSLLVVSQSVHPYVEADVEQPTSELSALTVWEVNNQVYDSDGLLPILTDEQFGTSSIGIYAGNDELFGEAIVIKIGDTQITTISGSAGRFIPRGGYHISQFSYNQGLNQLLWYVDGYSGSAVVNETISDKTVLLNFNSGSDVASLGKNSVYNSTVIYTASLDWDEMRHNDDFLYPRY
jgi:hypothetical protein